MILLVVSWLTVVLGFNYKLFIVMNFTFHYAKTLPKHHNVDTLIFGYIDLNDDITSVINDKVWIENHKTIKTFDELKEAVILINSKKRKLKTKQNLNNEPPKKQLKRSRK